MDPASPKPCFATLRRSRGSARHSAGQVAQDMEDEGKGRKKKEELTAKSTKGSKREVAEEGVIPECCLVSRP